MNGTDSKKDSKFNEVSFLLNQYTRQQKKLRMLTWPEKVRLVEKVKRSVLLMKFSKKGLTPHEDHETS